MYKHVDHTKCSEWMSCCVVSVFTSLCHIHNTSMLVDCHSKHVPGEELRVPGPAQVQLVQGSAQQLVVPAEAGAAAGLGADGPVQHHHQHDQRAHGGGDQTRVASLLHQHLGYVQCPASPSLAEPVRLTPLERGTLTGSPLTLNTRSAPNKQRVQVRVCICKRRFEAHQPQEEVNSLPHEKTNQVGT